MSYLFNWLHPPQVERGRPVGKDRLLLVTVLVLRVGDVRTVPAAFAPLFLPRGGAGERAGTSQSETQYSVPALSVTHRVIGQTT